MQARDRGGIAIGLVAVVGGLCLFVVLIGAAASAIIGGSAPEGATCAPISVAASSMELDAEQLANATIIVSVAAQMQLPERAAIIAVATALQESRLRNLDYGDRDSLGLFQQRPSQGWGAASQILDPAFSARAFYTRLVAIPGWQVLPLTVAAQSVQRSGSPGAYAQWETIADSVVTNLSSASCVTPGPGSSPTRGEVATQWALTQLGKPYVWGAAGPGSYDCSGLVMVAWEHAGIQLGRTTYMQWTQGIPVARDQIRPGDLVFFEPTPAGPGHVGLYIGDGKYINAPQPGWNVRIDSLGGSWAIAEYIGARRPG